MTERHHSIDPVHPGEILREDILPALSISKTAVADALGISRQTLYDILNERQPVTAEMAVRFGKLFGNGAGFWANLQRSHDLAVAVRTVGRFRDTDPGRPSIAGSAGGRAARDEARSDRGGGPQNGPYLEPDSRASWISSSWITRP